MDKMQIILLEKNNFNGERGDVYRLRFADHVLDISTFPNRVKYVQSNSCYSEL